MLKIEVLSLFRKGHDTFHPGELRMVSPEDAAHFCRAGWAKAAGLETGTPDTAEKTLEVHKSIIGQSAPNLGVK
jgi:hypothetical protein